MTAAGIGRDETDEARLATLFDAHHQRLYRLARRLSASTDEARDLVQETFLRVANRPGGIPRNVESEEAWLVRVLVNVARNEWRKQKGRRRLEQRHLHEVTVAPPSRPDVATVAHDTVWHAMRQLPPRRRAALILHELEGATVPRIAQFLGVSPITVRWHLAQGRRDLARIIDPGRKKS